MILTKKISLVFLGLLFISIGCDSDDEFEPVCESFIDPSGLSPNQTLFFELAFDQEFGQSAERLRKWASPIKIIVEGEVASPVLAEIDLVISELSDLSTAIAINRTTDASEANLRLFLGAKEDYVALVEPNAAGIAEGNSGFATIAWNNNFEITRASACVDVVNTTDEERLQHIVREELAQALGLINDTEEDENSIFYQFFSDATSYSPADERMISLMLGNELRAGMCANELLNIVK